MSEPTFVGGVRPTPEPVAALERLGDEIAELAVHLDAATARLLDLLRAFDARGGWNTGFRSCAEWLSWRVGLDPGAAREQVRVARALGRLPRLAGALARGELSYAKVRALTRVATPETEARLLAVGRAGTAAHVERLVRGWRRIDQRAEAREAARRHASRALHVYPDADGMVVLRGRLEPEVGALVLRALDAARERLYQQQRRAGGGATTPVAKITPEAVAPDAVPTPAEAGEPAWLATERPVATAAPVQDTVADTEAGAARPDRAPANAVGRPAVSGSFGIATDSWAVSDPASELPTTAQQRADALALLAECALRHELDPGAPGERYQVVVHVDAPVLAEPAAAGSAADPGNGAGVSSAARADSAAETGNAAAVGSAVDANNTAGADATEAGNAALEGGMRVSAETSRRLGCDASRVVLRHDVAGRVVEIGARTRTIPPALRRALQSRDRGCRFPGCQSPFGQGHHLRHWAHGGPTTLGNLALLCRRHHRAVHEGGYRVERLADGGLRFRRPDGRALPDVPAPPPVPAAPVEALRARHEAAGLRLHARTARPSWQGERLDLGWALDVLHPLAGPRPAHAATPAVRAVTPAVMEDAP